MEPRKQERIEYIVPAEVEIEGEITHGQIVDWTHDGLQILSVIPLKEYQTYHVNYYLERNRFDEEADLIEETWKGEGKTMWSHPYKGGSWIGVKFDEPIEIPLDNIKEFFTIEDYFFVALSSEKEQLQKMSQQALEDPPEKTSQPINTVTWIMWGAVILIQLIIFILLMKATDFIS